MPISYNEQTTLTCPSCGKDFEAEVWTIVDAIERPDLAQALRDGTLDVVTCPYCSYSSMAGAPLLFHDGERRRVYFAAPMDIDERMWRQQAEDLLYVLVGSLPEEARQAYLGDVQIEEGVAGVRRALLKQQRGKRIREQAGPNSQYTTTPINSTPSASPPSEVLDTVRLLIAADSMEEFQAIVQANPMLSTETTDNLIVQLIKTANDQEQRDVAAALQAARIKLAEMRHEQQLPRNEEQGDKQTSSNFPPPASLLTDTAYQTLLRISSTDELIEAVREYPSLLEPWVDGELITREESALEAGNEHLATDIEERREVLAELRAQLTNAELLGEAVQAVLGAKDEDSLAQVLIDYPVLLTTAVQDTLFTLAAEARSRGDTTLAEYAVECRAMLRKVREGLEA